MRACLLHPAWLLAAVACVPTSPDATDDDTEAPDTESADTESADTEVVDTDPVETDDTDDAGCAFQVEAVTAGEAFTIDTTGCWHVEVNHTQVAVFTPDRTGRVEMWGDPHENLNGKHLKDWEGARRTLLLPGGVILTLHADGPQGVMFLARLYDGAHFREIDLATNLMVDTSDDASVTRAQEAGEADGEAARLRLESDGRLFYDNVHDQAEDEEGTPGSKEPVTEPLGETGGASNPNLVRDFYDDPRLAHT